MRPRSVPQSQRDAALELVVKGCSIREIADKLEVKYGRASYLNTLAQETLKNVPVYALQALDAAKVKAGVDMVNSPPHYTKGGIETIDFIEAKGLGYRLGNVVKYITRADEKGSALENLKKAEWYLKREIAKRGGVEKC